MLPQIFVNANKISFRKICGQYVSAKTVKTEQKLNVSNSENRKLYLFGGASKSGHIIKEFVICGRCRDITIQNKYQLCFDNGRKPKK